MKLDRGTRGLIILAFLILALLGAGTIWFHTGPHPPDLQIEVFPGSEGTMLQVDHGGYAVYALLLWDPYTGELLWAVEGEIPPNTPPFRYGNPPSGTRQVFPRSGPSPDLPHEFYIAADLVYDRLLAPTSTALVFKIEHSSSGYSVVRIDPKEIPEEDRYDPELLPGRSPTGLDLWRDVEPSGS